MRKFFYVLISLAFTGLSCDFELIDEDDACVGLVNCKKTKDSILSW